MTSDEVNAAVGERADIDAEIEALERELAEPDERDRKAQRIADLKAQKTMQRRAELKAEAVDVLKGIRRGVGGLIDAQREAVEKMNRGAKLCAEGAAALEQHALKHSRMNRAAQLLTAAFKLPLTELPPAEVPARREGAEEAFGILRGIHLSGTLHINPQHDYEELGDLEAGDLLRELRALEPSPPTLTQAPPRLSPEDAALLAAEAQRSLRRVSLTKRRDSDSNPL